MNIPQRFSHIIPPPRSRAARNSTPELVHQRCRWRSHMHTLFLPQHELAKRGRHHHLTRRNRCPQFGWYCIRGDQTVQPLRQIVCRIHARGRAVEWIAGRAQRLGCRRRKCDGYNPVHPIRRLDLVWFGWDWVICEHRVWRIIDSDHLPPVKYGLHHPAKSLDGQCDRWRCHAILAS